MVLDVAIIGSGFGGLGAAVRLRKSGIHDIAILERADDVGGTWRDNTYPGCRCDVESIDFDSTRRLWTLRTSQGDVEARSVILATGPLAEPRMPDIEGLSDFSGALMHTAKWDHTVVLDAKRVAVIGTGASAVQAVPQIAPSVASLEVFQRTPTWILPHLGHPVRDRTRRMFQSIPFTQRLVRYLTYWRRELMVLGFVKDPRRMTKAETMAKEHLARQVSDPALRVKLTPQYRLGCKRVTISNDFYPALVRENVKLVNEPITRVSARGVHTSDGVLHEVDVIIAATGFMVTDHPIGERVRGAHGQSLANAFEGDLANYKGTSFPDFPNLFMLSGPNTGLGHSSIVFMEESQLNYVIEALKFALSTNSLVAPSNEAAVSWTRLVRQKLPDTVWASGCSSWYLNAHGENTTIWPDFTFAFRRATRHFDRADHTISY